MSCREFAVVVDQSAHYGAQIRGQLQSENRIPIALLSCRFANVNNYFQHCLCHYEASITGLSSSAPYKISTGIIVPVFPYRCLPVARAHHKKIFILSQHKVTCKLLLLGVCGRPFNYYYSMPTILFARTSHIVFYYFNCLPSFVKHSMLVEDIDSRHTRFAATRRAGLFPENLI